MRASATPAYVTAILSAIAVVLAALPTSANATPTNPDLRATLYAPRDGHGHSHGMSESAPLVELNETEVLLWHAPTPPSYYTADFEGEGVGPDETRHPGLMGLHVGLMCFAFFIALPAGIAMRSVKHAWHGVTVALFWASSIFGVASSALYRKLTPNMYEGATHASHSYFVLFVAVILTTVDTLSALRRLLTYVSGVRSGHHFFSLRSLWRIVVLDREDVPAGSASEYSKLAGDEDALQLSPIEEGEWSNNAPEDEVPASADSQRTVFGRVSFSRPKPLRRGSHRSDETLHDSMMVEVSRTKRSWLVRFGNGLFATTERVLVFAAFGQLIEGLVVYTGGCRQNYINGCLAHLIKGGIFWCYGLATFARYLGSFANLGWAWNQVPSGKKRVSAEFVECAVIFTYGITNIWMERFGAHPGDPFTTKQIQHISIAAMFWFAGLVGMGIESNRVRNWLAVAAASKSRSDTVVAPASYRSSFNPFPAVVIGVTGAAMAAHHQTYLFQVQIHDLWGKLLVAFAVLRCLTYFFLWLGPPTSVLPSRPPTEALSSFFLACGGLVFMLSTEEVTFAAMRCGRDDVMMFTNVAVAITCFAMTWTMGVVAFKGWLQTRSGPRPNIVLA